LGTIQNQRTGKTEKRYFKSKDDKRIIKFLKILI
jgi:hypothetical protein